MADIAIFRINYKSDFILTLNSDAGWMTPFCIKFWTGAPSQAYFVGFDGTTYTHCAPVDGEPTKLLVQFDDHNLPIGDLKFQIGYHFTVADFPTSVEDEVVNQASVIIEVDDVPAQVMLDLNGETAPEIEFSLPAYANEAQRIANEEQRIANEEQRIANEEARIAAETIRQQNEAQRISNEESRVTEFARLKQESETATADANAAAALANEKAALANDKAALADAAATLANEKAQLAADKAALAQAAATLANEKAALAQQKAAYAQTQGDYAKAQGDYAKEQGEIAEEDHERAEADHTRAESDHTQATSDHTQAGTDHSTAVNDHTQSVTDHTQADTDHTRAESDHTQAASDHTQAGADHTRAESDHTTASADHTQAGQDHTRAESDHTRAESDHAAVEVYVDSLGAFDISAYHATGGVLAKYADLTAALGTGGANIPDDLRKGGMSVKFVQSSDNKYVSYFLTKDTWSTNTDYWQKVNLESEVNLINDEVFGVEGNAVGGYYINSSKAIVAGEGFGVTGYIDVPAGDFQVYYASGSLTGKYLVFYNDNDETVGSAVQLNNVGGKTVSIPTGATKFRFSFDLSYDNVRCAYLSNVFYRPIIHIESLNTKIEDVKENADTLKSAVDSLKSAGYLYYGVVFPTQTISVTEKTFCIARRAGTYTNFGNITVNADEVTILKYDGSTWSKEICVAIRSAGVFCPSYPNMIREIYISDDITWSQVYFRAIDQDETHWRFIFAKDTSASEHRIIDVLKTDVDDIISINNQIVFFVRSEYLLTTGYSELFGVRDGYLSPTCYSHYLSTKLSNDIETVDGKVTAQGNQITNISGKVSSLESSINGQKGNYISDCYIKDTAKLAVSEGFAVSDYIDVPAGPFQVYYSSGGLAGKYLVFYNNSYVKVGDVVQLNNVGGKTVSIPSGATKFKFSFDLSYNDVRCAYLSNVFYRPTAEIQSLRTTVDGINGNCKEGYYINSNRNDVFDINYSISDFINVTGGTNISVYYSNQNEPGTFLDGYDSNGTIIQHTQMNGGAGAIAVSLDSLVAKIRFSFNRFYPNARVVASGVTIYTPVYGVDSIEKKANDYTDAQISSLRVRGNDPLMFTLIDDDFTNITMCEKLVTLCDSLGIKCTFALLPEYASNDPYTPSLPTATLEKIQDFQENGFSFAMHPNHHLFYMDEGSGVVTECEKCLVRLKQFFDENHILGGSRILVWPGDSDTQNNERLLPIAKRNVDIAVHAGLYGGQFYNTVVRFTSSRYQLRRMPLDFGFYTKTQMKAKIDEFVASGGGLMIFTSHVWQFVNDESTVDETTPSWANFTEVLTYAANKNIQFVNMNEVMYRKIEPEYMPSIKMVHV